MNETDHELEGTLVKGGADVSDAFQPGANDNTNPNSKGMQNSIDVSQTGATNANAEQASLHGVPNEIKYGKDFRVPELPPILQA